MFENSQKASQATQNALEGHTWAACLRPCLKICMRRTGLAACLHQVIKINKQFLDALWLLRKNSHW